MPSPAVRRPAVAGRFYPAKPEVLARELDQYLAADAAAPQKKMEAALGCVAPHAGYMYSGHVAGAVFHRIDVPELCLVLCPNHTGVGYPLAIMSEGEWETPLGNVPIDTAFAADLKSRLAALEEDATAHRAEHSAEVELP